MSGWEEGLGNAAETLSNPALPWAGAVVVVLAVLAWLSLRQTRPKPPAPPPPPVRLHPDPVVDAALREKARREQAEQDRLDANARRVANRDTAIRAGTLGLCPACRHLAPIRDGIVIGTHDDNPGGESGSCSRGIGERALPADHLIGHPGHV